MQRRNQLLVVVKCFPLAALLIRWPQIALGQLVLIVRGIAGGAGSVQLLAIVDAARAAPRFVRKRKLVSQTRSVSMQRLDDLMTPERYTRTLARVGTDGAPRRLRRRSWRR